MTGGPTVIPIPPRAAPPADHEAPEIAERSSYRRALSFSLLSFLLLAVFGVVTSIVLARAYGVEVIGQYALAFAPLGMMVFISSAQEQAALGRHLLTLPPRAPRVTQLTYAVMGFSLALTVVVGGIVAAVSYVLFTGPLDQPDLFAPAVALLVGYALVQNTCWNIDIVLLAFRAGRPLFWIRLQQALMFFVVALVASMVADSVWGLVLAWIGSWLVTLVTRLIALHGFMAFRITWPEMRLGLAELPGMIRFGLKATPGQLFGGINSQVGTVTLGMVSSVGVVGAWSRAQQLVVRVQDASLRLQEMLFPTLVERRENGDADGHDRALVDSIRLLLIGLLALAGSAGGAAYGVMALFGPGFDAAANALAILLLAQALAAIPACCTMCLYAANRPGIVSVVSGIACAANVSVCIAFSIALGGATGPALGVLVGQAVFGAFLLAAVRRELSTPLAQLMPWRSLVPLAPAYAGAFAASRLVDSALPTLAAPVAAMAVGAGVFVVVLVVTGCLSDRERARLAQLGERLPGPIRRLRVRRVAAAGDRP